MLYQLSIKLSFIPKNEKDADKESNNNLDRIPTECNLSSVHSEPQQ